MKRASELTKRLSEQLNTPVRLVITDNRRTMLSAKRRSGRLEVRLHHMFLRASESTVEAVVHYVAKGDPAAASTIDSFVESHRGHVAASARRTTTLRPKGDVYDLDEVKQHLAHQYFGGVCSASISWGNRVQARRRQRSLQLGTYLPDERLIRIHPVLDQPWVPRFFVESVVYHEMLHHVMPAKVRGSRRHYHTPEFRRREQEFAEQKRAEAWEKDNLWRLLRKRK